MLTNLQKFAIVAVPDAGTWVYASLSESETSEVTTNPRTLILTNQSTTKNMFFTIISLEDEDYVGNEEADDGLFLKAEGSYEIKMGSSVRAYKLGVKLDSPGGASETLVVSKTDYQEIKK